jgi:hypothetical protein
VRSPPALPPSTEGPVAVPCTRPFSAAPFIAMPPPASPVLRQAPWTKTYHGRGSPASVRASRLCKACAPDYRCEQQRSALMGGAAAPLRHGRASRRNGRFAAFHACPVRPVDRQRVRLAASAAGRSSGVRRKAEPARGVRVRRVTIDKDCWC